ncbi:MAG: hypothetical protein R3C56_11660 [Pirellulaceae bacterium]
MPAAALFVDGSGGQLLPVPDSPISRAVTSLSAASFSRRKTCCIGSLLPISSSKAKPVVAWRFEHFDLFMGMDERADVHEAANGPYDF